MSSSSWFARWARGRRSPVLRCIFPAFLLSSCLWVGCSRPKVEPEKPAERAEDAHRDEPKHEELPQQVRLTPEVIAAAGIQTTLVQKQRLSPTRTLSGELTVDPDRSAKIASPVAGRLEEVRLREGEKVKKGDVLALVRVPELGRLNGLRSAALARAKAARANADRLEGLSKASLATEQSYLDAKAEAEAQQAEANALGGQLQGLGSGASAGAPFLLPLRAPVSGLVVTRQAVVGQPVAADQVLGTVSDLSELWFLARLFEKDLEHVREGASVEVRLNAHPDTRFRGTVDLIGHQIDPVARTVLARVRLQNKDGLLRAGLFGTALVAVGKGDETPPVLVVPRSAVTEIAGKAVVFVRQEDGDFEVHPVVLGQSAPGIVAVLSGLREGEAVVSEGAFSIKSVVLKSTFGEED
jgi:membrane fusion protein, heavy metal efflux system